MGRVEPARSPRPLLLAATHLSDPARSYSRASHLHPARTISHPANILNFLEKSLPWCLVGAECSDFLWADGFSFARSTTTIAHTQHNHYNYCHRIDTADADTVWHNHFCFCCWAALAAAAAAKLLFTALTSSHNTSTNIVLQTLIWSRLPTQLLGLKISSKQDKLWHLWGD